MAEERLFTVEEANTLLPKLRRLVGKLKHHRHKLLELDPEVRRARDKADENGGSAYGSLYLQHLIRFSECAQEVEELGVIVKDVYTGLCDFPHMKEGRVVYLCWKLGEEEISWWHDIESGFAGRRPL